MNMTFSEKWVRTSRFILIAGIAVFASLILLGPERNGLDNPMSVKSAHALGDGIAAAPGYILLTAGVGQADRLCIVDKDNQVICMYSLLGGQLRLVSARKFDKDSDIFDASQPISNIRIEGGNGIDRDQAAAYGEEVQKAWEKAMNKPHK